MRRRLYLLPLLVAAMLLAGCVPLRRNPLSMNTFNSAASCPETKTPAVPNTTPTPDPGEPSDNLFWYGTY